jgi:hypothetical protein
VAKHRRRCPIIGRCGPVTVDSESLSMQTLPSSPTRTLVHRREVVCTGFTRSDGMFDVEAEMKDITAQGTDLYFKRLSAGEVIHRMRLVVTIDADLVIQHVEALTDSAPTPWCAEGNAAYAALKGLKIGSGFTRQVKALVGGTKGCTHLTELLGPLATTAMQTWFAVRRQNGSMRQQHDGVALIPRPHVVDTCRAYRADGQAVKVIWPEHRRPA